LRVDTILTFASGVLLLAATSAGAQTPLTDLNGRWAGRGTDRDSPLQSTQPTRCQVTVKADATHMTSDTECLGEAGLHKRIHLSVTFSGQQFSGNVEQTSDQRGSNSPPTRRAGSVTGNRNGDTAEFTVRFGGFTPNARVVLNLTSATSFSMLVSSLGATLTDVTYHRPAKR
jgi:hypothetical protein